MTPCSDNQTDAKKIEEMIKKQFQKEKVKKPKLAGGA